MPAYLLRLINLVVGPWFRMRQSYPTLFASLVHHHVTAGPHSISYFGNVNQAEGTLSQCLMFYRKIFVTSLQSSEEESEGKTVVLSQSVEEGHKENDLALNLSKLLDIGDVRARMILQKHPDFLNTDFYSLSKTLKYLVEECGVTVERLGDIPWVLLISPEMLEVKLKFVLAFLPIKLSRSIAISFVSLSSKRIIEMGTYWRVEAQKENVLKGRFCNRLEYLAHHLECSEVDVADCIFKVKALGTLPISKIEAVLNILLHGGVNPQYIKEDPWIFNHNLQVMKDRIQDAKNRNLSQIKPWMLRCSESKYESYVTRALEEQTAKGVEETIDGYLQKRLNCSPERVHEILIRVPSIKACKAKKMEQMISFLLAKGFTSADIAATPRVLSHRVTTVAKKLELLELTNRNWYPPKPLSLLCQSSKKYQKFTHLKKKDILMQAKNHREEGGGPKW